MCVCVCTRVLPRNTSLQHPRPPLPRQVISRRKQKQPSNVETMRSVKCDTTKISSAQCANICTVEIWRATCARVSTLSWWYQRATNEARDVASFWKRRGLTSILKRRVLPPLAALPPLPFASCSSSRDCGALHLPAPFKARNSTRRSHRSRKRESDVEEMKARATSTLVPESEISPFFSLKFTPLTLVRQS